VANVHITWWQINSVYYVAYQILSESSRFSRRWYNKKLIRRWDSERELSLRQHCALITKYNRLVHKFRHRSIGLCVRTHVFTKFSEITQLTAITSFTQSAQKATEFGEITQPLGLLRRSRSFKVTEFGTNRKPICNFLLMINSNLPPILHRFRDIASKRSKIATFFYHSLV